MGIKREGLRVQGFLIGLCLLAAALIVGCSDNSNNPLGPGTVAFFPLDQTTGVVTLPDGTTATFGYTPPPASIQALAAAANVTPLSVPVTIPSAASNQISFDLTTPQPVDEILIGELGAAGYIESSTKTSTNTSGPTTYHIVLRVKPTSIGLGTLLVLTRVGQIYTGAGIITVTNVQTGSVGTGG